MSGGINLGAAASNVAGAAANAAVGAVLGEIEYALIATGERSIDFIVPDCTIEEAHQDVSVITEFPVEIGAAITDHTYERPPGLIMRVGFSDCGQGHGYVQGVYQHFLGLKAARRPFTVATGKRFYEDMLIGGLDTVTDERSEWALFLTVTMRKIILTSTGDTAGKASLANQAMPAATAGTESTGPKQALPVAPAGGASSVLDSASTIGSQAGSFTGLSKGPTTSHGPITFDDGKTTTTLPASPGF